MARNQLNVVLTGFMGTGKSTVGRAIARQLGRNLVDTDRMIVAKHGPIATIFAEQGEDAFRTFEHEVAVELAGQRDLIISTGGRFLLDPENAAVLLQSGRAYCLVATVDEILDRTGRSARKRPLLNTPNPRQRIEQLMTERADGYGQFTQVSTSGLEPEEIATQIVHVHRLEEAQLHETPETTTCD